MEIKSGNETDNLSPNKKPRKEELAEVVVDIEENGKKPLRGKEDAATRVLTPEENPYEKAIIYLQKHSLPSLFQFLTVNLAYKRPDDAIEFMIEEVQKRSQQRQTEDQKTLS